jgi:hypothetical protein
MIKLVELTSNVPQELRLGSEISPVKLPGGSGCLYTLADGRTLHVAGSVARSLASLGMKPFESFMLIEHDKPGELPYTLVWLSPETEKARAKEEQPDLETQLRESLKIVSQGARPVPTPMPQRIAAPAAQLPATGTEGPLPQRKPIAAVASGGRGKAGPIPANVAFAEILEFTSAQLKAAGMQWNDQAVQDFCSTVWISGCKAGWIALWERAA